LLYQRLVNQNQGDKMEKLDKIMEVKVGEQEIEIDPRSKTLLTNLLTILVLVDLKWKFKVKVQY
jgi:hypothetical protein